MSLEENENTRRQREWEAGENLDDHNSELSETKAGYRYKTSAADHESRPDIRAKKARKADAQLSALQALLNDDPVYAAAYAKGGNTITDFEDRMNERLRKLDKQVEDIDEKLEALGPTATGSEAHKKLIEDREALHRQQQDLLDYHNATIQPMKDRMADQKHPPGKDDLDEFNDQVHRDMEVTFKADHEEQVTTDPVFTKIAELKLPDLGT